MRSAHYQLANCAILPSEPKLSLKLSGGVRRRGHPAIKAVLTTKPGEANLRNVTVTLPKGELLDSTHIGATCIAADFANGTCPASSVLGRAVATTPILDEPLTGTVYLRSSKRKLPDIAIDLKGQIDVVVTGQVGSVNGRLRTIFGSIPDVPVSRFQLNLLGGKKGLLSNSESLCGTSKSATVKTTGQNAVQTTTRAKLQAVGCGAKAAKKRRSHRKGA